MRTFSAHIRMIYVTDLASHSESSLQPLLYCCCFFFSFFFFYSFFLLVIYCMLPGAHSLMVELLSRASECVQSDSLISSHATVCISTSVLTIAVVAAALDAGLVREQHRMMPLIRLVLMTTMEHPAARLRFSPRWKRRRFAPGRRVEGREM